MSKIYSNPALPDNALVVISGVNGYVASHIAEEILAAGLRVRGTVRNLERCVWCQKLFDRKFGKGRFEMVKVEDMGVSGAFDEAVKGASGFIHTASNMTFDPNPHNVIPGVVEGIRIALKAAAAEPSMKRFVYTSSSTAIITPKPNIRRRIDPTTWNEMALEAAWKEPYDDVGHRRITYAASKAEGERTAWKFMEDEKPGFVLNAILPNMNIGSILDESQFETSITKWVTGLWKGNRDIVKGVSPQFFIDVSDDAKLHVAALLNPDVRNERILGFAAPYQFSDLLRVMRKNYPNRTFPDDIPNEGHDLTDVPNERGAELLKAFGQDGWTSLEDCVLKHTEALVAAGL